MTNNRDLLKEAIADAKSVKETAIANAKLALEEAFTPYLKDQLSAKLQEMDDEDEEKAPKKEEKEVEVKKENVEEINLDELLAELELNEDEKTDAEEEGYEDGMEDEKEDIDDEEVDLEDLSEDDLKSFIEDVIKDMVAAGEIEPGDEFADEDVDVEVEDEDVDVEVEDEDVDVEVELDEGYSNKDGDKDDSPTEIKSQKGRFAKNGDVSEADRFEEEMNVDVEVDESLAVAAGVASIFGGAVALDKAMDALEAGKLGEKGKAFAEFLRSQGESASARYAEGVEEDLGEIEELKQELQEVNLLNAKLLYTNKIFKAKNLTESKKVKVLKAFDKATDVKQAKAIYETLNEGIVNTITNSRVNESVKRGAASKASGLEPKAKKQPILESNEVYDRMRKLAGLI
jgi:hypothetical protein